MQRRGSTMKGRERAMREKRLYEASLSGSVDSLNELMKEDGLTLAQVCSTCLDETPLHIAAMLGHVDFATALLSLKPDLVAELNSQGFSPLHLASVNGHVEIVSNLLLVNTDICLVRDEDGRTPLHLAVMKGRIDVIIELVQARPDAVRYTLDRGEILLHSCVKHNRLGSLKVLVELGRINDIINVEDDDGNSILHIATALKQMETIKYLLSISAVKVNAVNGNGFTALDIIEHTPRDLKGMEIRESLLNAKALRTSNIPASACNTNQGITESGISPAAVPPSDVSRTVMVARSPSQVSGVEKHVNKNEDWLEKKRDALMVTATLIASMAYQAGLNPPGGVWQDDIYEDPNNKDGRILFHAGTSIMAAQRPGTYSIFWVLNTVSFVASLSTILLIVSGLPLKRRIVMWTLMAAMWVTITFMALTYLWSMKAVTPYGTHGITPYGTYGITPYGITRSHEIDGITPSSHEIDGITLLSPEIDGVTPVIVISVYAWLGLIGIVFLGHTVRLLMWCVSKSRKLGKNTLSSNVTEGQGEGNV